MLDPDTRRKYKMDHSSCVYIIMIKAYNVYLQRDDALAGLLVTPGEQVAVRQAILYYASVSTPQL